MHLLITINQCKTFQKRNLSFEPVFPRFLDFQPFYEVYMIIKRKFWFNKMVKIGVIVQEMDDREPVIEIFDGFEEIKPLVLEVFDEMTVSASNLYDLKMSKMDAESIEYALENKKLVKRFLEQN